MKLVFTSYSSVNEYDQPQEWLKRIQGYTGILEALAHEHEVISIERINYEGQLKQNGVDYHFIRFKKKVVRFPGRMHKIIKKMKPDVVFINGFIFPLQLIQLRMKLGKDVKIIILHRSEKPFSGLKRWLQKIANKKVDAYLFSSGEFGKEWNGIIDPSKIHEVVQASSVFAPGNKNSAREILSIKKDLPVFIWVGNLDKNKDPLTLIKSFKEYHLIEPKAVLYIVHQSNELINECKELIGDDGNIKLIGKIEHDQLENWYNAADFFISTSYYEGNGVAALEAMSCGCIPILSNIISFRRMTGPGKCGSLFEPGNAGDLLKSLLQTNEMNREAEKEKSLQQFRNELSFDSVAGKINKVLTILKNG